MSLDCTTTPVDAATRTRWDDADRVLNLSGVSRPVVSYWATVAPGAHALAHPRTVAGCPLCPPSVCPCGDAGCAEFGAHRAVFAAAETTWRQP